MRREEEDEVGKNGRRRGGDASVGWERREKRVDGWDLKGEI